MDIRIIAHNSTDYEAMVALRFSVLREPLGLTFSPSDLQQEKDDVLIALFEDAELVGCCILTKAGEDSLQLRQMAVHPRLQGKGRGRNILSFAEAETLKRGYSRLMMHARDAAVPFYQKCGYTLKGEGFIEVGILHYLMEKQLLH